MPEEIKARSLSIPIHTVDAFTDRAFGGNPAGVCLLDRAQRITLARGKTNRTYLRELVHHPLLNQILARTTSAFESAFFGNHALDRRTFETCWQELSELTRLTEQHA